MGILSPFLFGIQVILCWPFFMFRLYNPETIFFKKKKKKNSGVQQPHHRREFHSIPEQMSSCYRSCMENYCEEEREALASPDPAAQAKLNQWTEYDYIP